MSRPTKPLAARERMGVYKQLADVPPRYQLSRYTDQYAGQNVWETFCTTHEYKKGESEVFRKKVDLAGDHWRQFMNDRRHPALAKPADVTAWSEQLLAEYTHNTAYKYWIRVEHFYRWLQWHTEHPHVYHPPLMAVLDGDAAATIWEHKTENVRRQRRRRA